MRRVARSVVALSVTGVATGATLLLTQGGAAATAFAGGDVVVYQVGDGTHTLNNTAAAVSLVEYSPSGGSPIQTVSLPTTDSNGQHALTATGLSTSEGEISRSPDGRYLVVTGYDAPVGTNGPVVNSVQEGLTSTSPATVARTIGRVDGNGLVDTSTALGDANTPNIIRSATTKDGTHFDIAGGNGGLLSTTLGGTTTSQVAGTATSNLNGVSVQGDSPDDAVTFVSSSDTGGRLYSEASGTLTPLPGVSTTSLPFGYAFVDLGGAGYDGTGLDTLYVIDAADRAGAIDKYSYNGTTWVEAGTVALDGALGLAAVPTGTDHEVSIVVTTTKGLYTLTDPDGTDDSAFDATPSQIASAPAKDEFRGVAIAPAVLTGPSIVVDSPAANGKVTQGTGTIHFSAQVADADGVASVAVKLDGGSAITATETGTDSTDDTWTASIPAGSLPVGKHTLSITATDATGAAVSATTNSSFSIVAKAPTTPKGDIGKGATSLLSPLVSHSGFSAVTVKGAPAYKGKHQGLLTKKKGSVSFTFYGKKLVLHLVGNKKSGKLTITIGGKSHTVNLYRKHPASFTATYSVAKTSAVRVAIKASHKKAKASKGYQALLGWLVVS